MRSKQLTLMVLLMAMVFSCKDNNQQTDTDNLFKFRDYISYTTSGYISIADPIIINLANEQVGWDTDKNLDNDLISIKPYVEGRLVAKNKHSLHFIPDEYLKSDTEYTVTVHLGDLGKDIPKDYKDYTFQFKTIKPNFVINSNDLQSYSKDWQYLEATIKSADVMSLSDAKRLVSANQNGKTLKIAWNEANTEARFFQFKIDSIRRQVEDSEIEIKWDGDHLDIDNEGASTLKIPGKNNFTIVNVEAIRNPEQLISINFSDPIKKEQNFSGLISIKDQNAPNIVVDGNVLKVYPESRLVGNIQLEVFQGITNEEGYKLKQAFSELISFEELKPAVRLMSNGVILPNSNDLKFNFEAVNLSAVDVRIIKIFEDNVLQLLQDSDLANTYAREVRRVGRRIAKQTIQLQTPAENLGRWKAYSIDLSNFFKSDPGAIYRVELSFNKNYSLYECSAESNSSNEDEEYEDYWEEDYDIASNDGDDPFDDDSREEAYWDNLTYRYRNYSYNWRERDNPCHDAYYHEDRIVSQNLMGSNLGVIVKQGGNNSYFFAVTNILSTKPEANASVTLYNFQQQEIGSVITDGQGLALFDSHHHAAFAIAKKGKNTSYLRLHDGNSLSLSKFDVSGNHLQRGLKGYIYGERGVWRPGDSLFLTFVLDDSNTKLPKSHPVKTEITDPNGKLVYKKVSQENTNNFFKFVVPTSPEYATGNYSAKVSVGGADFYKNLKIETVKPNRLKINIDFEDEVLTKGKPLDGTLDVKWLHGAPAKNVKAEIKAKFNPDYSGFKSYPDYVFHDPTKRFQTEELIVFEGNVDSEGTASIKKSIEVGNNAPGMLTAQFLIRAFENGGDFSLDAFNKSYSPYSSYVGLRSPEGNAYGSYFTDTNQIFDVVAVDKDGKPLKRDKLEVKVYKIEWRWWWNSSYDNLSNYVSSSYHRPYLDQTLSTDANGKAQLKLKIPEDERGRYLIRIMDPVSGHATGRTAYFYKNWSNMSFDGDKEAAKMLVFSADKETYNVGETAKLSFPSGAEGRALISIENGAEVLEHRWVKTSQGKTEVSIPVTSDMAPNVFVNISLLQPHAVTSNDLPIRLYGVIPIMVEDPNTKLEPELKIPKQLKPEQEFEVVVSEKDRKAMTYTLAIVEEGLLDLTRYKTPNAWDEFYAKEALGVKTWDVFDDVIGAYSGSIDHVFAIGGDGSATEGKKKKANRFKPVVTYLGPFELPKGKQRTHKIKLPNYIGSVRAMVVAGNVKEEAYGSAEKTVPVKKPLMVLATLPRKLSPGEIVTLPVTVFAMENKIKNVTLDLKLSDGISALGASSQNLAFSKPDEQMAYFQLDVSKAKGINTVEVVASGNGERSTYKVEIDVENPNPISSKFENAVLEANASKTINFSTFGVEGTNSATVEFSTLPPMDFSRRLQYLIQYPHGCLEQSTSSAFPQLFLSDLFELTFDKKQDIQNNVEKGIKRIGNFQRPNGGLSYWMGENTANDWGTSYAGHFMLEAERKGYALPISFKSNWIRYQQQAARDWRPSYRHYNSDLAQAYRLYTLALAGSPDLAAMNRLREFEALSNNAKWRLAAAYALAGQNEASKELSLRANINFEPKQRDYYTYGSVDRNRAMALETMILSKNTKTRELSETIAKNLSSDRWMSTQTTAYCLLAMAKMVEANGGKNMNFSYSINGANESITTTKPIAQRDLKISEGTNEISVKNNGANSVYVRVLYSGKLPLGQELAEQRGLSMSVVYKNLDGKTISVDNLQQGQDFVATISVSNMKDYRVDDVALTQIIPSGWEIVNTRFTDFGSATPNQARYTDIRDDRVSYYFDLNKRGSNSTKTFSILLNASYLGKYYLPGTQVEAMYDHDFLVRTKGKWVEVRQ